MKSILRIGSLRSPPPIRLRSWTHLRCEGSEGSNGSEGSKGGGIALSGNAYEVSVTGLAFCVIWHDKHSADWLAALAPPIRAVPDFPLCRGQNKTPRSLASSAQRIAKNKVPPPGGRWWRQPPKGVHFLARQGGCMVSLRAKARLYSFPAPSVVP